MERVLFSLALFSCLIPATARAAITQKLSCEASIPAANGAMLIYQVAGQIDLDDAGKQTRPTAADSWLRMTVKSAAATVKSILPSIAQR